MDKEEANSMCDNIAELLNNFECVERIHLADYTCLMLSSKQRSTIYDSQGL